MEMVHTGQFTEMVTRRVAVDVRGAEPRRRGALNAAVDEKSAVCSLDSLPDTPPPLLPLQSRSGPLPPSDSLLSEMTWVTAR